MRKHLSIILFSILALCTPANQTPGASVAEEEEA